MLTDMQLQVEHVCRPIGDHSSAGALIITAVPKSRPHWHQSRLLIAVDFLLPAPLSTFCLQRGAGNKKSTLMPTQHRRQV